MHKINHGGTHFTSWAQERRSIDVNAAVSSLAYSPSSKLLAVAAGSKIQVMIAATLAVEAELTVDSSHNISAVTFCGTDAVVAAAFDSAPTRPGSQRLHAAIWDCNAPTKPTHNFESKVVEGGALCIAYGLRASKPIVAIGYADGVAKVWSWDGEILANLDGHEGVVNGIDISRDGAMVATASSDGSARVWTASDGGGCAVLRPAKKEAGPLNRIRFGCRRTAGLVVVASASGVALAFQLPASLSAPAAELAPLMVFKGHAANVHDVAIGENGEVLATASADKTIRLWLLRSGEHARALPGGGPVLALSFSGAGSANLASATARGALKVWGIVPRGREAGSMRPNR